MKRFIFFWLLTCPCHANADAFPEKELFNSMADPFGPEVDLNSKFPWIKNAQFHHQLHVFGVPLKEMRHWLEMDVSAEPQEREALLKRLEAGEVVLMNQDSWTSGFAGNGPRNFVEHSYPTAWDASNPKHLIRPSSGSIESRITGRSADVKISFLELPDHGLPLLKVHSEISSVRISAVQSWGKHGASVQSDGPIQYPVFETVTGNCDFTTRSGVPRCVGISGPVTFQGKDVLAVAFLRCTSEVFNRNVPLSKIGNPTPRVMKCVVTLPKREVPALLDRVTDARNLFDESLKSSGAVWRMDGISDSVQQDQPYPDEITEIGPSHFKIEHLSTSLEAGGQPATMILEKSAAPTEIIPPLLFKSEELLDVFPRLVIKKFGTSKPGIISFLGLHSRMPSLVNDWIANDQVELHFAINRGQVASQLTQSTTKSHIVALAVVELTDEAGPEELWARAWNDASSICLASEVGVDSVRLGKLQTWGRADQQTTDLLGLECSVKVVAADPFGASLEIALSADLFGQRLGITRPSTGDAHQVRLLDSKSPFHLPLRDVRVINTVKIPAKVSGGDSKAFVVLGQVL